MIRRHIRGRPSVVNLPSAVSLSRLLRRVLHGEKAHWSGELNVIFVDDIEIRRINRQFLNEKGTTDVIAFRSEAPSGVGSSESSADVFICEPEARRNAKRFQVPVKQELIRLAVHGVLHLLGYDDHKKSDRDKMWKRQEMFVSLWRAHR